VKDREKISRNTEREREIEKEMRDRKTKKN